MGKIKESFRGFDFYLFVIILMLVMFGTIMIWSASSYVTLHKQNNEYYYLIKQGRNLLIGIPAMMLASFYDYNKYKKKMLWVVLITLLLLVAVLIMGKDANGARRWIKLGSSLSFQPSEIAKYTVVLFLAKLMDKDGDKIFKFKTVIKYLLISSVFAGLVLLENNMSIFSVIMMVAMIMLFVDGARWYHLGGVCAAFGGLGGVLIAMKPYRLARVTSFLNPWADSQGNGYQIIQSLYALSSGKLFGVGLGESRQKAFFIPEPHNDFIFSIIGEELGFIGCLVIIILFCILITKGIKIAFDAKDTYGTLVAIGITSIIALQAIINVAVVTGSMPVTGVPLPFISYGGTAIIINLFAMGILMNVSKQGKKRK